MRSSDVAATRGQRGAAGTLERIAVPLAFVGIADFATKAAVVSSLTVGERRTVIAGWLDVTDLHNGAGAMGLFGERPVALVVLALAVVVALAAMLADVLRHSARAQVGFGLVAGGALANVYDRTVHGYVVDFVALRHFYVFNVADAAIALGLAFLAFGAFRPEPE